jgi:prepilin-type N-terminal cleavage/methylation domain-containing protein
MMKPPESRQNGFTLIELLTVVAILAILVGLSFGAFSKVTGKAQETACLNNLRQVAVGLISYATDNAGMFPSIGADDPPDKPQWFQLLGPYLGNADPYDPKSVLANPLEKPVKPYTPGSYTTFGGEYWRTIAPSTFLQDTHWSYRQVNCEKPAGTILAGAMQPAGWNQLATSDGYLVGNDHQYTWEVGTGPGCPRVYENKNHLSLVVMADGHTELIATNKLTQESAYWKWW